MALEDLTGSGKFISNLVATNPAPDDWADEGDDHLRGVKNVLRNTFPRASADALLPLVGMIGAFLIAAPVRWIPLDGRTINIANFPALFSVMGWPGPTVALPDFTGQFLRGWDTRSTPRFDQVAGGGPRAIGTTEQPGFPTHKHSISDPGHTHPLDEVMNPVSGPSGAATLLAQVGAATRTTRSGSTGITRAEWSVGADFASGFILSTDYDPRPSNVAVLWAIFADQ